MSSNISNILLTENIIQKIEQRSYDINKMRKHLINFTNNFREFKAIKANLINQLFEYESSFNQANNIFKTIYENIKNYEEIFADLKLKHLTNTEKINILTEENNKFQEDIFKLNKSNEFKNELNEDKDYFIKELLGKVKYLENIVRDYQKKIYIPKYTNVLDYKFNNFERFKDFYKSLKNTEASKNKDFNTDMHKINIHNNTKETYDSLNSNSNLNTKFNKTFSYNNKRNKSASSIRRKNYFKKNKCF